MEKITWYIRRKTEIYKKGDIMLFYGTLMMKGKQHSNKQQIFLNVPFVGTIAIEIKNATV